MAARLLAAAAAASLVPAGVAAQDRGDGDGSAATSMDLGGEMDLAPVVVSATRTETPVSEVTR